MYKKTFIMQCNGTMSTPEHGVKLLSFVEVLVCAFYTPMSACFARWACAWGGFQTLTTVTVTYYCLPFSSICPACIHCGWCFTSRVAAPNRP